MKKPNLTPGEWERVEDYLQEYADGYNHAAEIMDLVMGKLIRDNIFWGLIFSKPGEVYEALAYRLHEMQEEASHE